MLLKYFFSSSIGPAKENLAINFLLDHSLLHDLDAQRLARRPQDRRHSRALAASSFSILVMP